MSKPGGAKIGNRPLTRREFFTRPLKWIRGEPAPVEPVDPIPCRIPLNAIRDIPQSVLMRMTPVLRKGWTARIGQSGMAYRGSDGQDGMVSLGSKCVAAARLFDGTRTLAQVAAVLETELGLMPGGGTVIVRDAFITLCEHEVFHPDLPPQALSANSPEDYGDA
jgi:hypothetical protein